MNDRLKTISAAITTRLAPQCRYDRTIFVLSHMRAATTAVSNVLCSHQQISGYGEAHVPYVSQRSLGQLVVNQTKRRVYKPRAQFLFDKLLHNSLDDAVPPAFFQGRALFLLRPPVPTILSVLNLSDRMGLSQWQTADQAAHYYIERVARLCVLWSRFDRDHRLGILTEQLFADPDAAIARLADFVDLTPPLENRYQGQAASIKPGAGDPLQSAKHSRVEARPSDGTAELQLALPADVKKDCQDAYDALACEFEALG